MVYGLQDVIFLRQMMEGSQADELHKSIERQKLEAMLGLCEITSCRRQSLLDYFGEELQQACGNCDTCLEPVPVWDATEAARKALSAVYRCDQRFGVNHVIEVLLGKASDRVQELKHHQLSTFGIGKELDRNQWRSVFRQLVARGYLRVAPNSHGVLHLDDSCRPLLKGEQQIEMRQDKRKHESFRKRNDPQQKLDAEDYGLWNALKALRMQLSKEQDVPPYVIFHDATLMEMVMYRPLTHEQMGRLSGIGERKLDLYGDVFLEAIREDQQPEQEKDHQAQESVVLYKTGMTIAQVARQQHLSENVIYHHLAEGISEGLLSLPEVINITPDQLRQVQQVMCDCLSSVGVALKPVYEELGGAYEYGVLRCIRADMEKSQTP